VVTGGLLLMMLGASILGAFGKALLLRGRQQRAVDLAAVSAARSMRDDFPRLFQPAAGPDGRPNPAHLDRATYLEHARQVAVDIARENGSSAGRLVVDFPDGRSMAPARVRVRVVGPLRASDGTGGTHLIRSVATAAAELVPAAHTPAVIAPPAAPERASGGGYSGPLAYRQGKPMRPDVAVAFDRLAARARTAGLALIVVSGYRSDAEQARLFARHPDPRWVAPPGKSLHRFATELDLGPAGAYGWLAENARRFGFFKRYSWEPWHFGYIGGEPAEAGAAPMSRDGSDEAGERGLPAFVPSLYRRPIALAAERWNVPAELLGAQLYAESNFNPFARSGVGALGIAQFMPGTARSYGLRNPFDATASIQAQAHLMHDLLRRFGSVPLALAAYNAGPNAVGRCNCVPPYRETQGYVARILGLLGGAVGLAAPPPRLEVRLVSNVGR
jgi:hypothetical protein